MCGRFTITADLRDLQTRFEIVDTSKVALEPRYNVAPSQLVPVVLERDGHRVLEMMTWGFRPAWLKGTGRRPPPINARAETLLERPLFRTSVPRHRCILPADGWYEWQAPGGRKPKQPWHYRVKGGELFGFAGLWAESGDGPTCIIITTAANALAARVHERMPVVLRRTDEVAWLDGEETDPTSVVKLLRPYPARGMQAYPVGTLVNDARHDGPELIRRLG